MKGKAHLYKRPHINTDEIIPARYLTTADEAELAKHAMEGVDEGFITKVEKGDFIVAGEDFGCGSSREHAIWALRGAGIKAVIADSFARIFYRNAINNGFIAIECSISSRIDDQDELEIVLEKGIIRNITRNEEYSFVPLPEFALNIINAGGLLNYISR